MRNIGRSLSAFHGELHVFGFEFFAVVEFHTFFEFEMVGHIVDAFSLFSQAGAFDYFTFIVDVDQGFIDLTHHVGGSNIVRGDRIKTFGIIASGNAQNLIVHVSFDGLSRGKAKSDDEQKREYKS